MDKKLKLKNVEKKALLEKLTAYAGSELSEYQRATGYTWVEIAEDTRITASRFPEIKNPENYNNKNIGEKDLCKLIRSEILAITKMQSDLDLTLKETAYIDSLRHYEDASLHADINELIDLGGDPKDIIKDAIKRLKNNLCKETPTKK